MSELVQTIFSVTNDGLHKVITIFGIKFKIFSKTRALKTLLKKSLPTKSDLYATLTHPRVFSQFKNIYTGRDIVIVGCGPSLKYYKQLPDAIHIGVNRAFLSNNANLDYVFVGENFPDDISMQDLDEYRSQECIKFYLRQSESLKPLLKPQIKEYHYTKANAYEYYSRDYWGGNLSTNLITEPFSSGGSTIFTALEFALFTNPKNIYLVGCDCSDKGHFHNKIEGVTTDLRRLFREWKKAKKYVSEQFPNIKITSINPVGLKGLFNDIFTEDFINSIQTSRSK